MVPYISKSQMKCVLLLVLLAFLIMGSFFLAFDAVVMDFLVFVSGWRDLEGGCR
jgi:hypothetical protein